MTTTVIPPVRHYDGYLRIKLSKGSLIHLKSNINVDQELWSILDQYAEVKETGEKYLKSKTINPTQKDINKIKKSYLLFRACCRQAKNYYQSAKSLPNKSSALLYYYSFMNLAKALIISKDPVNHQAGWNHGLSENKSNSVSSISRHTIKIIRKNNAIFQSLYKIYFGINPNFQKLKINTLLSYCSDIGFQYQNTTGNYNKLVDGYLTIAVDKINKKGWGIVAVEGLDRILEYKSSFKDFLNLYDKISINQIQAKELFNFNAHMLSSFTIYQEKNIHNWIADNYLPQIDISNALNSTLRNRYQANLFDDIVGFYLTLPYDKKKTCLMNEPIAIYLIFFYLSSLVRYRPDFLEHIYEKQDMWLLDSFIRFCPETLLRNFVSMITGTDYVLIRR